MPMGPASCATFRLPAFPPTLIFRIFPLVSRATAYRTATRSHVPSPLSDLVDAARDSDEA